MMGTGLVSVIMPFFNSAAFIREAIESVFAQSYQDWELLVVDDGSTDGSTEIASGYAVRHPEHVSYFQHPAHSRHGASASRNLALRNAAGSFIALLDSDDVLDHFQLGRQVELLNDNPKMGLVYGNTLYWFSWTGNESDRHKDFIPNLWPLNTAIEPPHLLTLFLRGDATIPCTCSMLIRREAVARAGGFEDSFFSVFTDQALYAKLLLREHVLIVDECWGKYRQHPGSSVSIMKTSGRENQAYSHYLKWLERYLLDTSTTDPELWSALKQCFRHLHSPFAPSVIGQLDPLWTRLAQRLTQACRRLRGMSFGTIAADPNPVRAADGGPLVETTLKWHSHATESVEVRVGSPSGPLFAKSRSSGEKRTGTWVKNGMSFYLQDTSHGKASTSTGTIARVRVRVICSSSEDYKRSAHK